MRGLVLIGALFATPAYADYFVCEARNQSTQTSYITSVLVHSDTPSGEWCYKFAGRHADISGGGWQIFSTRWDDPETGNAGLKAFLDHSRAMRGHWDVHRVHLDAPLD